MTDMLIVVDMQRDFVTGPLGSAEARAIAPAVAARIRRAAEEGTQVVFTLDTHDADYMETREGRFLPVPHCIQGSEGWALVPEIAQECRRGMISFEKPTFGSTALAHHVAHATGDFQPMNANFGLIAPFERRIRNKQERYGQIAARALNVIEALRSNPLCADFD